MKEADNNTENGKLWVDHLGEGPLVATAIHAGHKIRRDLLPLLTLESAENEDSSSD